MKLQHEPFFIGEKRGLYDNLKTETHVESATIMRSEYTYTLENHKIALTKLYNLLLLLLSLAFCLNILHAITNFLSHSFTLTHIFFHPTAISFNKQKGCMKAYKSQKQTFHLFIICICSTIPARTHDYYACIEE
jgi:hypothetical protein